MPEAIRELDYQVMLHAFESHNGLGRLADERDPLGQCWARGSDVENGVAGGRKGWVWYENGGKKKKRDDEASKIH